VGTFEDTHKCVICKGDIEIERTVDGVAYWNRGHNAWPVAQGNCCYKCEENKVLPRRKLFNILNVFK
tara:strand:- start:385 stop:585 length:201 start_codon:yes stop_codon:yes gene_type:complete